MHFFLLGCKGAYVSHMDVSLKNCVLTPLCELSTACVVILLAVGAIEEEDEKDEYRST